MTSRRPKLAFRPRLLNQAEAAAYCGVSPNHFRDHVPVSPLKLGGKLLWDVRAIDRWLDRMNPDGYTVSTEEWLERFENDSAPAGG